ncbi:MAG: thioesterase domain-containing protein [Oleiphilaceae bacterium]|nr:thioesterase domain-containing protein [Oleiphilaceae bacterium]
MTRQEIQDYLHRHIPLSEVMGVAVVSTGSDEVVLSAPLAPNINHRATVFGGSASAVATLAAWTYLHLRLRESGVPGQLVIQRNSMNYEQPIPGDFQARARLVQPEKWPAFIRMLSRRGRARIRVEALLEYQGGKSGHFTGEFVALARE